MATRKPARRKTAAAKNSSVRDRRAAYRASAKPPQNAVKARVIELDFHVVLPPRSNAEAFSDELIELVEAYGGSVGGGTTGAEP